VKDKTPYVVVALQEAARMNTLLTEMRQSMEELLLGLGGSLNMSDKMEKLAIGGCHPSTVLVHMTAIKGQQHCCCVWHDKGMPTHPLAHVVLSKFVAVPHCRCRECIAHQLFC